MNTKNTIVTALIAFLAHLGSSHAMMSVPKTINVDQVKENHSFDSKTIGVDSHIGEFQKLLHKAGIVDEESGRLVSKDPNTLEARIAEASGDAFFCGATAGTLNLVEEENKDGSPGRKFLVGTAHGFYSDENIRNYYIHPRTKKKILCDDTSYGTFHPDVHYGPNNYFDLNIDYRKGYKFRMPPLNQADALKTKIDIINKNNVRDFVIIEAMDQELFERQTGGLRKTIIMADADPKVIIDYEGYNPFIISRRKNYGDFLVVSYEERCGLSDYIENGIQTRLKKHTCDTGPNSSGAFINIKDPADPETVYSLGIHYGGSQNKDNDIMQPGSTRDEVLDPFSDKGNFWITSEEVIRAMNKIPKSVSNNLGFR